MTFNFLKYLKTSLLCILVFMLCSVVLPLVAGEFELDHLKITSDPTDGTTYTGDREIDPTTKLIQSEDWEPEKVPPLIKYTIQSYAKGPGTLTFYLGTGARSQTVGSWENNGSPLSDGEGTYKWNTYRLNEDNYDFPDDYDEPYDDECVPWLNKGYQSEVVASTNSTLSIDGGRATFNTIDTHVGGAKTSQKKLEASAGWNTAEATIGYAKSSTQSWIYRPSATSLQVPEQSLSLSGSFSVTLNDINTSGSQTQNPPANCIPCAGCGEYMHPSRQFEHRWQCFAPAHLKPLKLVLYYICVPDQVELHKERTCGKLFCRRKYHHCSPGDPPCPWSFSDHSEEESRTSNTPGLSPSDGLYAAQPGDVHEAQLVTAVPYQSVHWSVNGTNVETDSGDGLTNEASLTYTFPSGVSGDYVISAYIYTGDNTIQTYSYTVSVSASASTSPSPTTVTVSASPGLSPLAGSSTVSRGNSHTAKLVTKAGGYSYVYFYLLPPGDSRHYGDSLGDAVRPSTSGVETELNFTVNFASDVTTGDYKLTAYIYPHATASDQTCYEYSYTITVE